MIKSFFISVLLVAGVSTLAQEEFAKEVEPKTVMMIGADYNRLGPTCSIYEGAGVSNFNNIGLEVGFLKMELKKNFNFMVRLGTTQGNFHHRDLQENINIYNGYLGSYNINEHRSDYYAGVVFGFQPIKQLEVAVPVHFSMRYTPYRQYFTIYEGQSIEGFTMEQAEQAAKDMGVQLQQNFNPGIRSGMEITAFPNSLFSVYTRFNWSYFEKRTVLDVENGTYDLQNSSYSIPSKGVKSTAEWGLAVGLRLNLRSL